MLPRACQTGPPAGQTIAPPRNQQPAATGPGVALRSSGVWRADVCFHDCDNATRPVPTAALVYIRRESCVGAVACSEPPAGSLSKHCVARGWLVLRLAKQHCCCLGANSELHRLPHHSGGCSGLARAVRRVVLVPCESEAPLVRDARDAKDCGSPSGSQLPGRLDQSRRCASSDLPNGPGSSSAVRMIGVVRPRGRGSMKMLFRIGRPVARMTDRGVL